MPKTEGRLFHLRNLAGYGLNGLANTRSITYIDNTTWILYVIYISKIIHKNITYFVLLSTQDK